ncbi:MAG: c-type cytochrome [Ignavibacteriae bacterium]|nr:c-type cytochrome [Ignavibacteriota bacterium]
MGMYRDGSENNYMIRIFKQRRLIPVEERRYGAIFVVSAVLLAVTTVWAVIDEVWVRRPWKEFQNEFHKLDLQKAEDELRQTQEKFESEEVQARYTDIQQQLRGAETALESEEYQKSFKELENIKAQIAEIAQELQFTRSEADETYYYFKTALHKGKPAEKEKQKLNKLEAEKERLSNYLDSLQEKRLEREQSLRTFEHTVERLKDSLTSSKADILVWQRKIEAIKSRSIEIKQIILPDFDDNNFGGKISRVERCVTCHLGVDKSGFENEKEPFSRHSYLLDLHPVEKFGCTPCHGGQGVALTARSAHGEVEFYHNPLLGEGTRERLCGKCHEDLEFPESPTLSDGRSLFESSGCLGCHNVEGYVKVPNIGPPLNRIAVKVKPAWLMRWILNPKSYLPQTKMPNFRFTEDEANAVRAYLLDASESAFGGPKLPDGSDRRQRITERSFDARWIQEGETIFRMARCISCHQVDGKGGTIAPDLVNITTKVQLDWLFDWIENPRAYQPNTKMPRYRFTDQEILKIITYLNSLKTSEISSEDENFAYSSGEVKRGEKLVIEYGCLGCHDPVGQEVVGGKVGADLTFFGDKPIENFDFGDVINLRTKEAWVLSKLQNPRVFATDRIIQKMPDFGFGKAEAKMLSTVLLGLTEERLPEPFIQKRRTVNDNAPLGEFRKLVDDLNCLTCHRIYGLGGTLAPDLSYEGSRANAEWLKEFLRNPTTLRPTLVERMPKFNLPEHEIDIIVNYMKTVLINNNIPSDFLNGTKISKEEIEKGRKLYYEKYRCQSCHQVNYEGGTMGPELISSDNNIRLRRTVGWIFQWIKNPKALDPATLEPVLGLSDEEALLITKYLLSY